MKAGLKPAFIFKNMNTKILSSVAVILAVFGLTASAQIRFACVGDSVTYGYGIENRDVNSYPAQLQQMLGNDYEVRNFGHSGATLLQHGHRPYTSLEEYPQALAFNPDIVVIHLGLNDTDPRDWPSWSDEFTGDYRSLIESFRKVNPEVRIWICEMSPIMHGHKRFLSGTRDWHGLIQKEIRRIAATDNVGLIDLYSPLLDRPDLLADNIHPDAEGAGIIAKTVYSAVTGDYGWLSMSRMYSDNMVLQREKPLAIRGTDNSGTEVTVELRTPSFRKGRRSKTVKGELVAEARAEAANGSWTAMLPALPAGGPYELEVRDAQNSICYKNVWLGEVWVCTGQSNMDFELKSCTTAGDDLAGAENNSLLHLYNFDENWITNNEEWPESALDSLNRLQYFKQSGWRCCNAENAGNFSAVGYHFGRVLADSLGCHVGLVCNSCGGATTESWTSTEVLRWHFPEILYNWNDGDFGQEWARGRAKLNIAKSKNHFQRHPYQPGYLFAAGAKTLDNYGIRGMVWYQGESNAHNIEAHEKLFRLMVKSWRKQWGEQLPVEMIQLSGISTRHSWPKFRDSQRRLAESLDGVYMTVSSDLGHPTDVHPRNKRPVGERAAASALHFVYGQTDVIPCGPVYKGFVKEGRALRLSFDNARGLKGGKTFELAGEDGMYYPATAVIEGTTVLVSSPEVENPCSVRYAWLPDPKEADLVNEAGYPCSTFKDEK